MDDLEKEIADLDAEFQMMVATYPVILEIVATNPDPKKALQGLEDLGRLIPDIKHMEALIEWVKAKDRTDRRNPQPDPYDAFVKGLEAGASREDLIELRNVVKRANPKDPRIPEMNQKIRDATL